MSDLSSWFTPGAPTNAPGAGQGSVASWFPAAPSTAAATPGAVGLPPAVAQFLQQLGVLPGGVPSATTGGAPGTTLAPLSPTVVPGETLAEFIARLRRGRDVAPEPPNPQLPGTDTGGSGGGTESFSAAPGTSFADMTGPQAVGTQALNTSNITGLASGAMQGNTTGTLMSLAGLMGLSPNTGNAVADAAINTAIGQILGHMLPSMPSAPGAGLALGGMNLFGGPSAISGAMSGEMSAPGVSYSVMPANDPLGLGAMNTAQSWADLSPTMAALLSLSEAGGKNTLQGYSTAQGLSGGAHPSISAAFGSPIGTAIGPPSPSEIAALAAALGVSMSNVDAAGNPTFAFGPSEAGFSMSPASVGTAFTGVGPVGMPGGGTGQPGGFALASNPTNGPQLDPATGQVTNRSDPEGGPPGGPNAPGPGLDGVSGPGPGTAGNPSGEEGGPSSGGGGGGSGSGDSVIISFLLSRAANPRARTFWARYRRDFLTQMPEAEHRFAQYQGLARRVIPKLDEKTINWAARVLMLRRRYQPEKFSHVRRRFVRVVAALARKTDEEVPAWASL